MITAIDSTLEFIEKEELAEFTPEKSQSPSPRKTKYASIPRTTGKLLYNLITESKAQAIVEVGSSVGYSTLWLAKGAIETKGHVWATEINTGRTKLFQKHIEMAQVAEFVTLLPIDALLVLENWKEPSPDFIFIDAFKKDYPIYFEKALQLLKLDGLIVFDNILSHYSIVSEFVENVRSNPRVTTTLDEQDNGLLIIKKVH